MFPKYGRGVIQTFSYTNDEASVKCGSATLKYNWVTESMGFQCDHQNRQHCKSQNHGCRKAGQHQGIDILDRRTTSKEVWRMRHIFIHWKFSLFFSCVLHKRVLTWVKVISDNNELHGLNSCLQTVSWDILSQSSFHCFPPHLSPLIRQDAATTQKQKQIIENKEHCSKLELAPSWLPLISAGLSFPLIPAIPRQFTNTIAVMN